MFKERKLFIFADAVSSHDFIRDSVIIKGNCFVHTDTRVSFRRFRITRETYILHFEVKNSRTLNDLLLTQKKKKMKKRESAN